MANNKTVKMARQILRDLALPDGPRNEAQTAIDLAGALIESEDRVATLEARLREVLSEFPEAAGGHFYRESGGAQRMVAERTHRALQKARRALKGGANEKDLRSKSKR